MKMKEVRVEELSELELFECLKSNSVRLFVPSHRISQHVF